MPPDIRDAAQLWDMLRYARIVAELVAGRTFAEYERDVQFRLAVERAVEIVGEAARGVSDRFRTAHPEISWRLIVAQRHVLAHDYGEILNDRLWEVATVYVRDLIARLEPLISEPPR